ncbi:predicted protein [Histoplasma capsulatum G186AR]|uniref:Uncharacterized protein n=1 Tax=Ajellomyces capsulatus (strain G186AR / H82 / ATCC MYA-2454 / RMSCC 2432) TaxID=447093 RepID=C0NG06_AJECG|nr:uncharacterized protein HCBG_01822 [Histoplasma capsulatum G186AR]EEH10177.1 predicted protein [Histoplasma capsulatum G186AR]
MSDKMNGFSSSTKASFVEGKWEQMDTSKSKRQMGARRSRKYSGPNRPEADHSVCVAPPREGEVTCEALNRQGSVAQHHAWKVDRRPLEVDSVQAGTGRGLVEVVSLVQGVDRAYWTGEVDAY